MITKISIKKFDHSKDIELPRYATEQSAGLDLCAAINQEIVIAPGQIEIVPTGIAIALPKNTEAQIRPRSGLAAAHRITVLNTPGTIDADYRGEIKVILINHGKNNFVITRGMRIAQMVIAPYIQADLIEVNSLDETTRGIGGFGSTGH